MSLFPDKGSEQRKEEILQRSPFLRTFLDSTAFRLNPQKWHEDLKTHGNGVIEDMTTVLGDKWTRLTIMPLLINARILDVLHPLMPIQTKFTVVKGIVVAGFEVGSQEDVQFVLIDIVQQLRDDESLNPSCLVNTPDIRKAEDFITTLLMTGAFLKEASLIDSRRNRPNSIDDFIKGLDFKGFE